MSFVKEVFGGDEQKYTSHFQAKKKNSIGRIQLIEGMEYELPFLIAIRPFVEGGVPDHDVCIMHYFLKSEGEDYGGIIPFEKTLILLNAVVTGINMAKQKPKVEASKKQESKPAPPPTPEASQFSDEELGTSNATERENPKEEINNIFGASEEEAELNINMSNFQPPEPSSYSIEPEPPANQMTNELINRCQELSINPDLNIDEIDQKLKEISFQRQSLDDMNKQLRQAFATNQIDMNQYQQQFAELNGYVKSIDQQEEVLQALRALHA